MKSLEKADKFWWVFEKMKKKEDLGLNDPLSLSLSLCFLIYNGVD